MYSIRGTSLFEVLIALFILSVNALALIKHEWFLNYRLHQQEQKSAVIIFIDSLAQASNKKIETNAELLSHIRKILPNFVLQQGMDRSLTLTWGKEEYSQVVSSTSYKESWSFLQ